MSMFKSNFFEAATLGAIPGVKSIELTGYLSALAAGERTIWRNAAAYVQLTTAVAFEAISASANDVAVTGTGARTIEADMVDGNYAETTVSITMNGVAAVAIPGTFLACNAIRVITAGSGGTNAGAIDVRTTAPVIKNSINAGFPSLGSSSSFIYTVPAGCRALLRNLSIGVTGATGDLTFGLSLYTSTGVRSIVNAIGKGTCFTAINDGQVLDGLGSGIVVPEKTLIHLGGTASAGAGVAMASADLFVFDTRVSGLL